MATKTTNVNSSTYTAITAKSVCRKIDIGEDAQAGTTDYYLSETGADSDKVTRPAGAKTPFENPMCFDPGDVVIYVKTASGSVAFASVETGA